MRDITHIVVHHSASVLTTTAEDLERWHVAGNGWSDVGYHWIVEMDGSLHAGRPLDVVGAHVRGHNAQSWGICLVGDNTTLRERWVSYQIRTLKSVLLVLQALAPEAVVLGHRDLEGTATECPGLDVRQLLGLSPIANS